MTVGTMPNTDLDPIGDRFKWRLRSELNRITPRYSPPRYLAAPRRRAGPWRFAPAGLALGLVGMLGLTAYAATGSPNPVVWTQQIVTRMGPNGSESSPAAEPSSEPAPRLVAPEAPSPNRESEPTSRPQPSQSPEPRESPDPRESPEPTPTGSGAPGDR